MRRKSFFVFIVVSISSLLASTVATAVEPADTVAVNGRIYTVNETQPWAEAIAIRDSNIVYVGDNAGAREFIGADTSIADLGGRFVMPGIVSGHEHPLVTSAIASAFFIPFPQEKEPILDAVRQHLVDSPDGPFWAFGGNREGTVDIHRQDIDAIIDDRPFLIVANSGHGAWLNTAGLTELGLMEAGAKAPVDGYETGDDGNPNGFLSTSAATMYALTQLGLIRKEDIVENLPEILARHNAEGITAVLDAGQPPGSEENVWAAASELEEQGTLNLRISASSIAQRPFHLEGAFDALEKLSSKYQSENFTVNTLKIHGGSPDGWSSPLLEPYSDRPDYSGPVIFPYNVRLDATMKAAENGYYVHTHVIGDRAIREALDAFQAAREAGYGDVRLSTGHSSLVHPDDVPRYVENDVTVNWMMATLCQPDETNTARLGPERIEYLCNFRSIADTGARLSLSADAPTAPLSPMLQIEVAMLQKMPEQIEALRDGRTGLTLEEAIRGYTMGSAHMIGWEDIIGSLEVGKRADLIVLDQNLFEIEPTEIHETNVLLTMLNGKVVHEQAVDWSSSDTGITTDLLGGHE